MIEQLETMARTIRRHVLTMSCEARAPHVASALSCVEILVALFFHAARLDPTSPASPDRDRIILSKGHAAAALYACLAERGFFPVATLHDSCRDGGAMGEHPSYGTLPGIECTSGSLGHGLGVGTGMALALGQDGRPGRVFVVLSDGECNEGSTWEAAIWTPTRPLGNLTAVVDFNGLQATGRSTEITRLEPLGGKWHSFGWEVTEVDGHDLEQLTRVLGRRDDARPHAVIAHTTKGKGVSFMENDLEWHYRPPSDDDLARALAELEDPSR